MDIEGRRLLRHHSGQRLTAEQNINNFKMVQDKEFRSGTEGPGTVPVPLSAGNLDQDTKS